MRSRIFLLGISIITLTHSHVLMFTGGVIICLLGMYFTNGKSVKRKLEKIVLRSSVRCIAWGSTTLFHLMYFDKLDYTPGSVFLDTAVVIDHIRDDRYLIQDKQNRGFFLNIEKNLELGDRIFISGRLSPGLISSPLGKNHAQTGALSWNGYEFQYPYRLLMRGIYGDIWGENILIIDRGQGDRLTRMRKTIAQQIENTFENDSSQAFLGGILLGETGKFTDVQYTQFIESGLVHLVAVSGGNMIFVMILLSILLFRMPFYLRMSVIGIALIGYALLCGGDSSVLRALVMSLLGLAALFGGRTVNFRRSIQLTLVILLTFNPYFLWYDIGFIFSFGALFGLKILSPYFQYIPSQKTKKLMPLIWGYNNYVVPSFAATIGVFPFLMLFTQQINLISVFTNILIAPIIPVLIVSGLFTLMFPLTIMIDTITRICTQIFSLSQLSSIFGIYLVAHSQLFASGFLIIRTALMIWLSLRKPDEGKKIDGKKK